jgi:hypothetical protein
MTTRRFLLAVCLSMVITFALAVVWIAFPIVSLLVRQSDGGPDSGGIAVVSGGVRSSTLIITECVVFAIVFCLLYRKRAS